MWHVDLDELEELGRSVRLLGVERRGVHSIRSGDHLGDPTRTIRQNITGYLADHGVGAAGAGITLLTNARVLGHVFNPVSLFYCRVGSDRVTHVVAEVSNTHGERHCYLVEPSPDGVCHAPKTFYVSPFLPVGGTYTLIVPEPGDRLLARVELEQQGHPAFAAQLTGRRLPLRDRTLAQMLLRHPMMTWQVSALIRRHGVGLWAHGVPVIPHAPSAAGGAQ
jgi:DUF1365 family protein